MMQIAVETLRSTITVTCDDLEIRDNLLCLIKNGKRLFVFKEWLYFEYIEEAKS